MSFFQYVQILKKLDRLKERLVRAENKTYTIRISELSDMPRGGGGSFDQMTNKVVKLDELRGKVHEVENLIRDIEWDLKLTNVEIRLIRYRYVYKLTWKEVGSLLDISARHTIRIHQKILEKFRKN